MPRNHGNLRESIFFVCGKTLMSRCVACAHTYACMHVCKCWWNVILHSTPNCVQLDTRIHTCQRWCCCCFCCCFVIEVYEYWALHVCGATVFTMWMCSYVPLVVFMHVIICSCVRNGDAVAAVAVAVDVTIASAHSYTRSHAHIHILTVLYTHTHT